MNIFFDYFGNPMSWVFMGLFILVGVLVGLFLRPWMGNKVLKLMPSDHRFQELPVDEETAISIQCKKVKGMPLQRFFKYHPGFTGIVGRFLKKPISLFLGLEGTAYTWKPQEGAWIKLGTLAQALLSIWGVDFYNSVPQIMRDKLEESRIQVTVGMDKAPITPEGRRSISEEDIKSEEDRKASQTFWSERASQMKGYLINLLLAGGTGFGIALALQIVGILDISPQKNPTPSPSETAGMLVGAAIRYIIGMV